MYTYRYSIIYEAAFSNIVEPIKLSVLKLNLFLCKSGFLELWEHAFNRLIHDYKHLEIKQLQTDKQSIQILSICIVILLSLPLQTITSFVEVEYMNLTD